MGNNIVTNSALLAKEQEIDQSDKCQERTLNDYNKTIFYWASFLCSQNGLKESPITHFLQERTGLPKGEIKIPTLKKIINSIIEEHGECCWVDLGCGFQLAQRSFKKRGWDERKNIHLVGIDLVDWSIKKDFLRTKPVRRQIEPLLDPQFKPKLIIGDATKLKLKRPVHLVTGIETLQYFNDKLATLCHWYNQLAPNGMMFVSSHDREWFDDMRPAGAIMSSECEKMSYDVEKQLNDHGIRWYGVQPKGSRPHLLEQQSILFVKEKGGFHSFSGGVS
jgi:trans-aconitate methyltransferase